MTSNIQLEQTERAENICNISNHKSLLVRLSIAEYDFENASVEKKKMEKNRLMLCCNDNYDTSHTHHCV